MQKFTGILLKEKLMMNGNLSKRKSPQGAFSGLLIYAGCPSHATIR